jgi:hypothetical protein
MKVALYQCLTLHSTTGASVTAIHSFKATGELYSIHQQIQQPTQNAWVTPSPLKSKLYLTRAYAHPKAHYVSQFELLR